MTSFVVNPRFSKEEMESIEELVRNGTAKNRSDLVRKATIFYLQEKAWKKAKGE
jgi:Predicted transcriptional regulators containing the CopG/Arc/MetJ DNA-binding domain and a metal-binding domain